jgi:hypothetical protein
LILSGAITDTAELTIQTTAANGNIVLTPNGTGNVNTGANVSVTGRVTAASVVGGVITGTSTSVTGTTTAASVVGGVITGTSTSVTGTTTAASVVGGVITGSSTSVTGTTTTGGTTTSGGYISQTQSTNVMSRISLVNSVRNWSISNYGNQFSPNGSFTIADETGAAVRLQITTDGITSITGSLGVSGNATIGNVLTGGLLSSTGNVQGGNLRTVGLITATGNVTGNFFIGNGSVLTGIPLKTLGQQVIAANTTLTSSNYGTNILVTVAGITITLPTTAPSGTVISISNLANGTLNLSYTGSSGTDGPISLQYQQNIMLISDGGSPTSFWRQFFGSPGYLPAGTGFVGTTFVSLTATGNVQGGNLRTVGLISATGAVTGAALTGTSLTVSTGNITGGNIVNANANGVGNIGSATTYFNTVFAKATSAQYADLAENYLADDEYAPGTVVIFGGDNEITITTEMADERVAGAISTNPAYLMNTGQTGLPVALRGRVPVKVTGPVEKGDSLVTSSVAGYAVSVGRDCGYGQAVFAKSLETNNDTGTKVITAVIL